MVKKRPIKVREEIRQAYPNEKNEEMLRRLQSIWDFEDSFGKPQKREK